MKRFNRAYVASLSLLAMLIFICNVFAQERDVRDKGTKSKPPGKLSSQFPSGGGGGNAILSGENLNLNIGTLPAGDDIIISYSVVVDNPLPAGVTEITNQGTVTSGNFPNTLTDDPDVGGAADPTVTTVTNSDVGVIAINSPVGGGPLTNAESVTITIMNFTADDQTGFDVSYIVTGPVNSGPVTENIGALVVPGNSTQVYAFTAAADFSQPGSYTILAGTSLNNDINTSNDTSSTIISTVLPVPILHSPANNAINIPVPAILKWFSVNGALSYILQVSKFSNFSSFILNSELSDTTQSVTGLESLTKYYWRVKAKDLLTESDWSSVWNLTTALLPPGLVYPADGATGLSLAFELVWAKVPAAATYHVQVSKNINFTGQLIADKTGLKNTTYKLKGKDLTTGTTFYWRVRSFKSGVYSSFSPIWSFTTVPPSANSIKIMITAAAGLLSKNALVNSPSGALNSSALYFESEEAGASFDINIPQTTEWYAWARMYYEGSGGKNSFFISANQQKHILGDDDEMYDQWHWDGYNSSGVNLGTLAAGKNRITISGRETGTSLWIDKLILTDDPFYFPDDETLSSDNFLSAGSNETVPAEFQLTQNYPNPFNPNTQIRFSLPVQGNVILQIYNTTGQLVKTLQDGVLSEGNYEYQWDASDNSGIKVSSGVYFYRINVIGSSANFSKINKMILLK